ncbi:type I-E CRISPR-associated protein Cas6/Cse3/CasE [Streptomyces erythrochromogenes]|uniref:type I-E CRISPR-associated protein Cas6/Cse3/CasE n=1 Tax=Streptomyces erythrochromogenes TaxID=285574 RepID=UPI0037F388B4
MNRYVDYSSDRRDPSPHSAGFRAWRSILHLSPRGTQAFEDAHSMYQSLKSCLASRHEPAEQSLLYAVSRASAAGPQRPGSPVRILVQTRTEPNWTPLLRRGFVLTASAHWTEQIWHPGQLATIAVTASPLIIQPATLPPRDRPAGTTVRDWFRGSLQAAGCSHVTAITYSGEITTRQRDEPVIMRRFNARVKVVNTARFATFLASPLGTNRCWGAGLVLATSE